MTDLNVIPPVNSMPEISKNYLNSDVGMGRGVYI